MMQSRPAHSAFSESRSRQIHCVNASRGAFVGTKPLTNGQPNREGSAFDANATPDRLSAFSDGVFAVIITILVLDLKPPKAPNLEALVSMWPAAMGYGVSYLFIATVWVNHHHLLRHADVATTRLIWSNFAHLFTVSFIPFSTAWIAQTELAAVPVSVYATVFAAMNATHLLLCMEAVDRHQSREIPRHTRMAMRIRSLATLAPSCSLPLLLSCIPKLASRSFVYV